MPRIPVVAYQTPVGTSNGSTSQPMRGPALPREQFRDRTQNRTQTAARSATVQATSSDDANCTVLRNISFTSGVTQTLAHYLTDSKGRPRAWTSYRIENMQIAAARFFAAHVSPTADAAFIAVTADANCIADVRVW